jgi:hypothetical protein
VHWPERWHNPYPPDGISAGRVAPDLCSRGVRPNLTLTMALAASRQACRWEAALA